MYLKVISLLAIFSFSKNGRIKLIDTAKEKIFDATKAVSEVAYELGFKYPQHFTRLFKLRVGHTPHEYRMLN